MSFSKQNWRPCKLYQQISGSKSHIDGKILPAMSIQILLSEGNLQFLFCTGARFHALCEFSDQRVYDDMPLLA